MLEKTKFWFEGLLRPKGDAVFNELLKLLKKTVREGFYGEIIIKISDGKIVRVVKSESIKVES